MAKRKRFTAQARGKEIDFHSVIKSSLLQAIIHDFAIGLTKDEITKKYNMKRNDVDKFKRLYLPDIAKLEAQLKAETAKASNSVEVQDWEIDPSTGKTYHELSEEFSIVDSPTEPEQETQPQPQEEQQPEEPEIHFVNESDWKSKKVTPDMARKILSDLGEHVLSQSDLAKMYGVSPSIISLIKNGKGPFRIVDVTKEPDPEPVIESTTDEENIANTPESEAASIPQTEDETVSEEQPTEENVVRIDDGHLIAIPIVDTQEEQDKIEAQLSSDSILSQRIPVTQYIICGMIDGRHSLPVKQYIFSDINGDLFVDYDEQYRIAKARIEELMGNYNDNSRSKGLCMYITGLASVQATIIKVCMDLKINLTLMHYNPESGGYYAQEIITSFGDENPCPQELFSFRCGQLYSYKCKAKHLLETGEGFMVLEYVIDPTDDKDWLAFINTGYDNERVKYEMNREILSNGQIMIPGGFPKTATYCSTEYDAYMVFHALATNENANVFIAPIALNSYRHGIILRKTLQRQINMNWM